MRNVRNPSDFGDGYYELWEDYTSHCNLALLAGYRRLAARLEFRDGGQHGTLQVLFGIFPFFQCAAEQFDKQGKSHTAKSTEKDR